MFSVPLLLKPQIPLKLGKLLFRVVLQKPGWVYQVERKINVSWFLLGSPGKNSTAT
jgi:hypothetical protein